MLAKLQKLQETHRAMILLTAQISIGDWFTFIGIIVTIILSTAVVVSQTKNRTQKDFFIKEIDSLKSDYLEFAHLIRSGALSAESIRDELRNYSGRISMLSEFLSREYTSIDNKVFLYHGDFQSTVTGYDSVSNQFSMPSVTLSHNEKTSLDKTLLPVHKSFIELIVSINKATKRAPWLEE